MLKGDVKQAFLDDLASFQRRVGYPGGPPSMAAALQLARARHGVRLAVNRELEPRIQAAEAKRQRRRERNLRMASLVASTS